MNSVRRILELLRFERKEITAIYLYAILNGIIQLSLPLGIQSIISFVMGGALSTSLVLLITLVVLGVFVTGWMQVNQMKIIDTLNSVGAKCSVIDVRAGQMGATLRALRDIGFLDAARKGQITFAVFHILGPSVASLDEIAETSGYMTDGNYFLVKNFINNTTFFEWNPQTYNSYFKHAKGTHEITIPKLNEMACEQVELASVPYVSFIANKGATGEPAAFSFVLRGYVRHWLGSVWSEYDKAKLMDLIGTEGSDAGFKLGSHFLRKGEADGWNGPNFFGDVVGWAVGLGAGDGARRAGIPDPDRPHRHPPASPVDRRGQLHQRRLHHRRRRPLRPLRDRCRTEFLLL